MVRKQFASEGPSTIEGIACLRLLHKTAEANRRRVAKALLEVGCNANVVDLASGVSPLHMAAEHGFA